MVVVERHLPHCLRKRGGDFAAGVVTAKQHIGNSIARLRASKPRFEDGVGVLVFPAQRERAAIHEYQNQWLAGLFQGLQQRQLLAGQAEVDAAGGLAGHALRLAHYRDYHVGGLGNLHGFFNHVVGRARVDIQLPAVGLKALQHLGIVGNVGSLGIGDFQAGRSGAQALLDRHGLLPVAGPAPTPYYVALAVGQRADKGNRTGFFQGQDVALVFEEHEAAPGNVARGGDEFGLHQRAGGARGAHVAVGVLEEAKPVFSFENAAAGGVELRLAHGPRLDILSHVLKENFAHHVLVDARVQRQGRYLGGGAHAMFHQLVDGSVIRYHKACKAPLTAQKVGHQPLVGSGGHAVDVVERRHDRARAGVDGGFVGR